MAKKKKDEIAEKLSALKPNIPTSTRRVSKSPKIEKEEVEKRDESILLMRDNLSAFEELNSIFLGVNYELFKSLIQSWQKTLNIYAEILVNNTSYLLGSLFKKH
ncbi:MAG: hypothetical protein D6828_01905 [Nitrospirae bacterium]|nr:MAG: hypothetical protein D6828_01905 [Nitrospirota bacterium]